MKLNAIQLKHTAHFHSIQLNLNEQPITLIMGEQGSGKSSLLKHTFQALTWFSARLKDGRSSGVSMMDQDIEHGRQQSKINISVRIDADLGSFAEATTTQAQDTQQCGWQIYKVLANAGGVGTSQATIGQLEQLVQLYQRAQKADPMQGLPLIAYYPQDRFVSEINLVSKNNPAIFQSPHAYEFTGIPFTTFTRFFEWLREIHDIENAQSAQLLQQFLQQHPQLDPLEQQFQSQLLLAQKQLHAPSLLALKHSLKTVLPEIEDLFLQYQPKLQLMVKYQGQLIQYLQLPHSLRNWIALVGDIVRRLCVLNPKSIAPCQEGNGILLIDAVDHQLDDLHCQDILLRLHQAFPQLQIIATGQHSELLDQQQHYQCYRLFEQRLIPITAQTTQLQFDQLYSELFKEPCHEPISLQEPNLEDPVISLLTQIQQQLSPQQQQQLIQQLRDGEQPFVENR